MKRRFILYFLLLTVTCSLFSACSGKLQVGAEQTREYLPLLQHKRVALFSNHTGMVGDKHTLDILVENGVNVTAIFSPEHGFRGTAGAGDNVANSVDEKTGVPILSLYNKGSYSPSEESMNQFDVLVVDIQDVGLRFYTYYISMVRLMDACADYSKQVIILDRPNPNGFYVDGPILDMRFKSGVGWLPIPVVHGMTLGELALMVNGEHWLTDGKQCDVKVIPCRHYTHQTLYRLPVPPSPNLQNMLAVYLYPSMCYFEATPVSLGRGTDLPFLCYGHPDYRIPANDSASLHSPLSASLNFKHSTFNYISFTPHSMSSALEPPQQDQLCYGIDLSTMSEQEAMQRGVDLTFLIDAYTNLMVPHDTLHSPLQTNPLSTSLNSKLNMNSPLQTNQLSTSLNSKLSTLNSFFSPFFEKLIGVDYVRPMIEQGHSAEEICAMWKDDVEQFKQQRKPYLLYKE